MASPFLTPVMTLPEYLKGNDIDDNARPLVEMFAKSSDVMEVLPFEGISGPVYTGFRQAALPASMGFRAVNAASTSGAGNVTPFQEATYLIDHDIPVDRAIVDRGGPRRRAWEEQMGMARLGELWVTKFLKGDNTVTSTEFSGLQKRSAQYGRSFDNSLGTSGGAALSLAQLDWAVQNCRNPTHIISPWSLRYRWIQAARTTALTGYVIQTWDDVGKPKLSYAGKPLLFGYEKDLHAPILPFTEVAPAGGPAQTSSLYPVNFSEGGVRGIQIKPMEIRDVGLLQDSITYNTHISWDVGLVVEHLFAFTRLSGVQNLPIVA
ncbi:hypothetical protein SAMN05519103_00346 [Rhizobiales bacterium GAS113]|nr:hypothetical protein SAMN05519103_00346 [Rhizobiales bacterium GAS113]